MGTYQLDKTPSCFRIRRRRTDIHKSIFCNGLRIFSSVTCADNPARILIDSGPYSRLRYFQISSQRESSFHLFSNTNSGIITTIKWILLRSKGPMKKCLFYLVAAWVGVLSASSANIVICVQPSGVARMQLTDHQCCWACCDSTCAACSIPTRESGCFLHADECCRDMVFPFPPAPVVTTVFSVPAASIAWLDPVQINSYNSKMPCNSRDSRLCDPAVETAMLLI